MTADAQGLLTATLSAPLTVTRGENTLTAQDLGASYPLTTSYAGSGLVWNAGLTAMPAFRERPAVAQGADGTIYAVGGDVNLVTQDSTFLYHPASDSWSTGRTFPYTVEGAQAQALPDGRIAVFGGSSGCYFSTNCTIYTAGHVYDPATDTWDSAETVGAMSTPRYRFASVTLGGQLYAIGGWTGVTNTATMERYDPVARTCDTTATNGQPLPPFTSAPGSPGDGLEQLAAAVGPDGRIYVAGGLTGPPDDSAGAGSPPSHPVTTVYIYDPASNTWTLGPSLPVQAADLAATQFSATLGPDGQVYVLGGFASIPGRYDLKSGGLALVVALDPRTLRWVRATSLPAAVNGRTVLTTPNGQIVVVGDAQVIIGTVPAALGGAIPFHPHQTVRFSDKLSASVDLADGHVDVTADGLSIPARGPDLSLSHTWDSQRAATGDATTAGSGWSDDLTPQMGGVLTQTVVYTDGVGTRWLFPYFGSTSGSGPFSQYDVPPGQPWVLTTSPITGYTLSNILSGEVLSFDAQGRLHTDTDAYGNQNSLTAGTNQPTSLTNSGGRSLAFSYQSGLLADVQSPLWQSGGATVAGSQHVTYGYTNTTQLSRITWGAGTTDALTATFGYQGQQLITITTPYTQSASPHVWTLGYDDFGRVISVTSPMSGQVGQAGYTPSYTTAFSYSVGMSQTQVIEGLGTSGALTHTYTLDAQGNAPQLTDVAGQGHVRTAAFDVDHDVISGTDALGNTTLYTYTYAGPTGSVGLLTQEQQPGISAGTLNNGLTPVITSYAYDPATHDRLREDKPNGGEIYDTYDGHHAISTTVELTAYAQQCGSAPLGGGTAAPGGGATTPSGAVPNTPCQSTPLYRGSVNQYDQYGELIATTDGRGVDVSATQGQTPTATLDPRTGPLYTSHFSYDGQGDQTASGTPPIVTTLGGVTRSAPVTTTTGYDGDGNAISTTSANGNTSTTTYDHLGRVVQTTDPRVTLWDGTTNTPTTTTRYDGDGNVIQTVDPNGAATTSSYDPLGRLVATTDPVSGTQLITYTATREAAAQDPAGNVTRYTDNSVGEVIRVDNPVSGTVQYQYDGLGQTIAITSGPAAGPPTQLETRGYDALSELITDTIGGVGTMTQTTLTAYDLDGNPSEVQHPDSNVTLTSYDYADELTDVTLAKLGSGPFTTQDAYGYDAAGNQTDDHDANSFDHVQAYDADNRLLQELDRTYQQAGTETITTTRGFDPDANVITQTVQEQQPTAQTHADSYSYNADDWLTHKTQDGVPLTYGYDAAGHQRSQTIVNDAVPVTTQRDAAGRTTAIGEAAAGTTTYTATFGYNAASQPTTITVPGGVQELAQYDQGNRLSGVSATGPATATNPLSSSYAYSQTAMGWTSAETDTINTVNGGQPVVQTYTHDPVGRLSRVQGASGTQSYGYDGNDNITAITTSAGTTTYAYNGAAANELTSVIAPSQPITSYGYDALGDTTSITDTAGSNISLSYDKQERLIGVTLSNGTQIGMAYTAQGQRASYTVSPQGQTQPSLSETFTYREGQLGQAVVTGTGVTTPYTDTYLYGINGAPLELLRQYAGQALQRYWYVLNGHSDVVALTDASGSVVDRYGYDAWGAPLASQTTEQVPQPLRYAGYWYDTELGWYAVGLRNYDPHLMRWLQPDPSGRDGGPSYVYVHDDPVDTIDPTGLDEIAGLPGDNGLNFLFGGAFAGLVLLVTSSAALTVAAGVGVVVLGVGTAVLIRGIIYHIGHVEFGPTRTATIPAALPQQGGVQATQVAGGTTVTTPTQINVPTIHQFARQSKGRPRSNVAQNRQFDAAVREIERRLGRRLSKEEIRELHDALHDEANPGYDEIVQLGLQLFG